MEQKKISKYTNGKQIKKVRKPSKKEKKEIVPILPLMAIVTAIITTLIYMTNFYRFDIGESMYIAKFFWTGKTVAQHNLMVQFFEAVYLIATDGLLMF